MTDQHLITPPRELKQKWHEEAAHRQYSVSETEDHLFEQAAQWGYDQRGEVNEAKLQQARDEELEACCEWLGTQLLDDYDLEPIADDLRAARRAARHHHHTGE